VVVIIPGVGGNRGINFTGRSRRRFLRFASGGVAAMPEGTPFSGT